MGKYINIQDDIFSIFSSAAWQAENIKTIPANYVGIDIPSEFIKVSIVPRGSGINLKSVSGVIIIDIFTKAGNGPKQAFTIADKLDEYLVGRTFPVQDTNTEIGTSAMEVFGIDKDNKALFRTTYSVPFNYFEVV